MKNDSKSMEKEGCNHIGTEQVPLPNYPLIVESLPTEPNEQQACVDEKDHGFTNYVEENLEPKQNDVMVDMYQNYEK